MWSIAGLWPATFSPKKKNGLYCLSHPCSHISLCFLFFSVFFMGFFFCLFCFLLIFSAQTQKHQFGQSRSIKVGQSRSKFFAQSRFGQSRSQPKLVPFRKIDLNFGGSTSKDTQPNCFAFFNRATEPFPPPFFGRLFG